MVYQRLVPRRLLAGVALLALIILVGIAGFMVSGLSAVDALLTTVSAVTTVGYAPPGPLSAGAKVFNAALILAGVGTGIYVLGSLTEFLMEGGLHGTWKQRRTVRRMQDLVDHYIISGFGRVGQRAATQLAAANALFVIVDTNPETIAVARAQGFLCHEGDATRNAVTRGRGSETRARTAGMCRFRREQRVCRAGGPGAQFGSIYRGAGGGS